MRKDYKNCSLTMTVSSRLSFLLFDSQWQLQQDRSSPAVKRQSRAFRTGNILCNTQEHVPYKNCVGAGECENVSSLNSCIRLFTKQCTYPSDVDAHLVSYAMILDNQSAEGKFQVCCRRSKNYKLHKKQKKTCLMAPLCDIHININLCVFM